MTRSCTAVAAFFAGAIRDVVARLILAALSPRASALAGSELLDPERTATRLAAFCAAEHPDRFVEYNSEISGQNRRYRTDVGQIEESQQSRFAIRNAFESRGINSRDSQ